MRGGLSAVVSSLPKKGCVLFRESLVSVVRCVVGDVDVDIDIPAGALDVPEGTEGTLEASEVSEAEMIVCGKFFPCAHDQRSCRSAF